MLMKSIDRDPKTHFELVERALAQMDFPGLDKETVKHEMAAFIQCILSRPERLTSSINTLHTEMWREMYRLAKLKDPYKRIKRFSNTFAVELMQGLCLDSLDDLINAAVVANRLDFGSFAFVEADLPVTPALFREVPTWFADDRTVLKKALAAARKILYLVDNHGEVLFDKALIQGLQRDFPKCSLVVAGKAAPLLNDVTAAELEDLGFRDFCGIVSTGTNFLGVPRSEVSAAFVDSFNDADLVIAKGQAYLEFWTEYSTDKVFHLANAKVHIVDSVLGSIPPGANLVLHSKNYAHPLKPTY
jgi:damage-control phosphatase, subfamily I